MFKNNNFTPEKAPPRKAVTVSILNLDAGARAREFGLDYKAAEMFFEGHSLKFDPNSGSWGHDLGGQTSKRTTETNNGKIEKPSSEVHQKIEALEQENNLLKVQNDILLDMMSETISELKLSSKLSSS